jgi:uncharacterized repeat protein (TIGR02543 family)
VNLPFATTESIQLIAIPANGYRFDGWSGDVTDKTETITIIMNCTKSVTANFVPILTVDVSPANSGTVKIANQPLKTYPADYTFAIDDTVQLTAMPASGYRFTGWSGSITAKTEIIAIKMTGGNNITAIFAPITYHLSISINPKTGGQVTLEPPQPPDGYIIGTKVTLYTTPDEGYLFKKWAGGISGTDSPITITANSDKSIVATFAPTSLPAVWLWVSCGLGVVLVGYLVFLFAFRKRLQ